MAELQNENETSNASYIIYEIYNPASKHGGEYRMEKIGEYDELKGYAVKNRGSKYWVRKNMSDVTFKSAVVVCLLEQKYLLFIVSSKF